MVRSSSDRFLVEREMGGRSLKHLAKKFIGHRSGVESRGIDGEMSRAIMRQARLETLLESFTVEQDRAHRSTRLLLAATNQDVQRGFKENNASIR
jgi:hypothetical protein